VQGKIPIRCKLVLYVEIPCKQHEVWAIIGLNSYMTIQCTEGIGTADSWFFLRKDLNLSMRSTRGRDPAYKPPQEVVPR
jgi:hypothetical protein